MPIVLKPEAQAKKAEAQAKEESKERPSLALQASNDAYKFFRISSHDRFGEEELNGFLSSHQVLGVGRKFVEQGDNSYWFFCVDYAEPSSRSGGTGKRTKNRIDYRELLSPADFAVFAYCSTADGINLERQMT